jgi:MFS family permease
LSDKFGRRKVFISGVVGSGIMIFVYFSVISTGNIPMIFLASTLITAGTYAASNSVYPAWFSELFNVKVRYSGMAIGLQVGILCAGFTPLLGTALVGATKANWGPAAWIVAASSVGRVLSAGGRRRTLGPRNPQDAAARTGQPGPLTHRWPASLNHRSITGAGAGPAAWRRATPS